MDLFLSYNSVDRDLVQRVQKVLEARGISTFIDRDNLVVGLPWPEALEQGLRDVRAVAVFIGRQLGGYQKREMWFALDRQVREEKQGRVFPVIPVVLPAADLTPGFLFLNTWIDLRDGLRGDLAGAVTAKAIDAFERAIRGEPRKQQSVAEPTEASAAARPYRGLEAFREEDAAFFIGREAFSQRLLEFTLAKDLVAVVGPSGSGKSSVVQAGLLPLLRRQRPPEKTWDAITFTPGHEPFNRLASALISLLEPDLRETKRLVEAQELGENIANGRVKLGAAIERVIQKSKGTGRLLVVADQFEELFTLAPTSERAPFANALLGALGSAPLTLLLTLRADFYSQTIGLSRELNDSLASAQVNIGALTAAELKESITRPAELVGVKFEPGLVERILADVSSEPGYLPLAEFALTELWQRRQGTLLTHDTYKEFKGVAGALGERAEVEFAKFTIEQQAAARRLFSRLVRVAGPEEAGEDTRQRLDLAGVNAVTQQVVQVLARPDIRLLVTSSDEETGDQTVEVVHEALIRNWERLRYWLNEDREFLLWRQRVQAGAAEWERKGRDDGLLLRGVGLTEGERWLAERPTELISSEETFIKQSVEQREELKAAVERSRRRVTAGLALGLLVAAVLALVAGLQWRQSRIQNQLASERLVRNYWSSAINAKKNDWPQAVHFFALSGKESTEPGQIKDSIFNIQDFGGSLFLTTEINHGGKVRGALFSRDESLILVWGSDGSVRIWHARDGAPASVLMRHQHVIGARFNKGEDLILSWGEDGTARLWHVRDGSPAAQPMSHGDALQGATFSQDEKLVLTWGNDGSARLWHSENGLPATPPMQHKKWLPMATFSPDERFILTSSADGTARLWYASDGSPAGRPMMHGRDVSGAIFNNDQRLILTWGADTARLWHARDGSPAAQPMKHEDLVIGATFSSDSNLILTWSNDGTARLWHTSDGSPAGLPMKHPSSVTKAVFNNDGRLVLTWAFDGTVRLWHTKDGSPATPPMKHTSWVNSAKLSDDEQLVVTSSGDGTARLWTAGDGSLAVPPMIHGAEVDGATFSRDGKRILTWSHDGLVRLWQYSSRYQPLVCEKGVEGTRFNRAGDRILTWSNDGTGRLWHTNDGSPATPPMRHDAEVLGALFSEDERLVLTWSVDGTARLWHSDDGSLATPPMRHEALIYGAAFDRNDDLVLTWSADGTARQWRSSTGMLATPPMKHEGPLHGIERLVDVPLKDKAPVLGAVFSKDDRLILTWGMDGTVRLWQSRDGMPAASPIRALVLGALFSHDERHILTWGLDGKARLWHTADGSAAVQPMSYEGNLADIILGGFGATFSKDDRLILTWGDITSQLWHASNGSAAGEPMRHEDLGVKGLRAIFSRNEDFVLSWGTDDAARLWNTRDGSPAGKPMNHQGRVLGGTFSNDERLILTWSDDHTARLWHTPDGSPAAQPMWHEDSVVGATFSNDERLILTWSNDHTARLWHTRDGSPAARPMVQAGPITGATFSKDERFVSTWSRGDKTTRLWDVEADYDFPGEYLPLLVEVVTGTEMDSFGNVHAIDIQRWQEKKQQYIGIAEKHLRTCKYLSANLYVRQKTLWQSH
jgi:WD40 repeat protein